MLELHKFALLPKEGAVRIQKMIALKICVDSAAERMVRVLHLPLEISLPGFMDF